MVSGLIDIVCTHFSYQEIPIADSHIFVHKIKNGEPASGESGRSEKVLQMLEENFGQERGGPHPSFIHRIRIMRRNIIQQAREQREQNFVKTRFPLRS